MPRPGRHHANRVQRRRRRRASVRTAVERLESRLLPGGLIDLVASATCAAAFDLLAEEGPPSELLRGEREAAAHAGRDHRVPIDRNELTSWEDGPSRLRPKRLGIIRQAEAARAHDHLGLCVWDADVWNADVWNADVWNADYREVGDVGQDRIEAFDGLPPAAPNIAGEQLLVDAFFVGDGPAELMTTAASRAAQFDGRPSTYAVRSPAAILASHGTLPPSLATPARPPSQLAYQAAAPPTLPALIPGGSSTSSSPPPQQQFGVPAPPDRGEGESGLPPAPAGAMDPTAPEETAPEETAPEETAPEETAPEETAPEETAPEETTPEETTPEETTPEETTPEETTPEETTPEQPLDPQSPDPLPPAPGPPPTTPPVDETPSGDPSDGCEGEPATAVRFDSIPSSVEEMEVITLTGTVQNGYPEQPKLGDKWVTLNYEPTNNFESSSWKLTGYFNDDGAMAITSKGGYYCGEATASAQIEVTNVAPTIESLAGDASIFEGGEVVLTLAFSDAHNEYAMASEKWTITVDWGDSTSQQYVIDNRAAVPDFSFGFIDRPAGSPVVVEQVLRHTYVDDAYGDTPTPNEVAKYPVNVTVSDGLDSDSSGMTVEVTNQPPTVSIESVKPLDNVLQNDRVDESEGFTVTGTVLDPGTADTHTATLTVDLNWDGDFADPGEKVQLDLQADPDLPGQFVFHHTVGAVMDDGGSPGNGTPQDNLKLFVQVVDDDTGEGHAASQVTVHNEPPLIATSTLTFDVVYDNLGNVAQVQLRGTLRDHGTQDKHAVIVHWGDGVTTVASVIGNDVNRAIESIRSLPPSFGQSAIRLFPITLEVHDDDTGEDSLQVHGQVNWGFDAAAAITVNGNKPVQQLAPRQVGATWIGFWAGDWNLTFDAVIENSDSVSGNSWVLSTWNQYNLNTTQDFSNPELLKQAAGEQLFEVTCDRETGVIQHTYVHQPGKTGIYSANGNLIGRSKTNDGVIKNGALTAYGSVRVDSRRQPHVTTVEVTQRVEAAIANDIVLADKAGIGVVLPSGGMSFEFGKEATYQGGLNAPGIRHTTYTCREKIILSYRRPAP